ncbi:hypothetical protein [Labilibaculum manganireducens]|nr:hypothetical protein [Labilibaculum manganireducens]
MKKLELKQMEKVNGGASAARCARMYARLKRRGDDETSRLGGRFVKNC